MIGAMTSLSAFRSIAALFVGCVVLSVGVLLVGYDVMSFVTRCTDMVGLVMLRYMAVEVA